MSAPRGVRVEELGFCPASGRAPNAGGLLLAYGVCLAAAALALVDFFNGHAALGFFDLLISMPAFWRVVLGERALSAQLVEEF